MFFSISEKPHFISKMSLETLGEFGSELEIPCSVTGEPRPNVTWWVNFSSVKWSYYLHFLSLIKTI